MTNICDRCETGTKQAGAVCQHLVHGEFLTYNTSSADADTLPDAACTCCYIDYAAKGDVPEVWGEMGIHMLCSACCRQVLARHVLPTEDEQRRGYALVPAETYYYFAKGRERPELDELDRDVHVKLGFCPIPSAYPRSVEKMWVRICGASDDGLFTGQLDNDPDFLAPSVLRDGAEISFRMEHVLEVRVR